MYYKVIITKTVWYWLKDRTKLKIRKYTHTTDFNEICKGYSVEQR